MAWYNEESPETLNFVVVGNDYAGHSLLQASLAAHPNMACHMDSCLLYISWHFFLQTRLPKGGE